MQGPSRNYIKAGYGFNVGQDFTRADCDTPIQVDVVKGRNVWGWIYGNPDHSLGFMRLSRVRVCVDKSGVVMQSGD